MKNKTHAECFIDTRILHKQLEIGKDFSSWIKNIIKKRDLIEGTDYQIVRPSNRNHNHGGSNKKDYMVTKSVSDLIQLAHSLKPKSKNIQEDAALATIEQLLNITLIKQYKVGSYRIDGYCKETNTAYEIDEPQHFVGGKLKQECIERQSYVESKLGCTFKRIKV